MRKGGRRNRGSGVGSVGHNWLPAYLSNLILQLNWFSSILFVINGLFNSVWLNSSRPAPADQSSIALQRSLWLILPPMERPLKASRFHHCARRVSPCAKHYTGFWLFGKKGPVHQCVAETKAGYLIYVCSIAEHLCARTQVSVPFFIRSHHVDCPPQYLHDKIISSFKT